MSPEGSYRGAAEAGRAAHALGAIGNPVAPRDPEVSSALRAIERSVESIEGGVRFTHERLSRVIPPIPAQTGAANKTSCGYSTQLAQEIDALNERLFRASQSLEELLNRVEL